MPIYEQQFGGPIFVTRDGIHGQEKAVLEEVYGVMDSDLAPEELKTALRDSIHDVSNATLPEQMNAGRMYLFGVSSGSGGNPTARIDSMFFAVGRILQTSNVVAPACSAVDLAFWARNTRDRGGRAEWSDRVARLMKLGFTNIDIADPIPSTVPVVGRTLITTSEQNYGFPPEGCRFEVLDSYLALGRLSVREDIRNVLVQIISPHLNPDYS